MIQRAVNRLYRIRMREEAFNDSSPGRGFQRIPAPIQGQQPVEFEAGARESRQFVCYVSGISVGLTASTQNQMQYREHSQVVSASIRLIMSTPTAVNRAKSS